MLYDSVKHEPEILFDSSYIKIPLLYVCTDFNIRKLSNRCYINNYPNSLKIV